MILLQIFRIIYSYTNFINYTISFNAFDLLNKYFDIYLN